MKINDSKKLTSKQRELADKWIKENALSWGVGSASVSEINKMGLSKATFSAFRRAVQNCVKNGSVRVGYLLIDAFYIPYLRGIRMPKKILRLRSEQAKKLNFSGQQMAIINGDEKSFSIAAASIIAKVYRDKLMTSLSKRFQFKKYHWGKNKGYGTKEHREAILKYGITKIHRKKFVESYLLLLLFSNSIENLTRAFCSFLFSDGVL